MLGNAAHAKSSGDRRWHVALPLVLGGLSLAAAPHACHSVPLALVLLTVATSGTWGIYGPLFSWPAAWPGVDGDTAACSVAIINSLGNGGGLVGPFLVGWLSKLEGGVEAEEHTHALTALAACAVLAGALAAMFPTSPREPWRLPFRRAAGSSLRGLRA